MSALTLSDAERQAFRRMAPGDKLRLIAGMHTQARAWKRAALKTQHPDWSPEQLDRRVKEVFFYGTG